MLPLMLRENTAIFHLIDDFAADATPYAAALLSPDAAAFF